MKPLTCDGAVDPRLLRPTWRYRVKRFFPEHREAIILAAAILMLMIAGYKGIVAVGSLFGM